MTRIGAFCSGIILISTLDYLGDGRYLAAAVGGFLLVWNAGTLICDLRANKQEEASLIAEIRRLRAEIAALSRRRF